MRRSSATPSPGRSLQELLEKKRLVRFCISLALALGFHVLPLGADLTPQAHGVLSTLLFIVLLWGTEAVAYPISAFFFVAGMILFTAFEPGSDGAALGTKHALQNALRGFCSSTWFLILAALTLAANIRLSGLGQRAALTVLAHAGAKPRNILLGVLAMCFILSLFIPSQAATAALMTAVCIGLIDVFHMDRRGNLAKSLLLLMVYGTTFGGIGVLTSGAASVQAAGYIAQGAGHVISWLQWMLYGLPYALTLGLVLFIMTERMFPVENKEFPGGRAALRRELEKLGPMASREKKILAIMCGTVFFWASEGILHSVDATSVAALAVAAMCIPGAGSAPWRELKEAVDWATLLLLGAALSLGQALIETGAAAWVAQNTLVRLGAGTLPPSVLIAVCGVFFASFSLAFSARAAAVAALIPAIIGFSYALPASMDLQPWGLTLILYYCIQFTLVLPVNAPISMLAYSTDTFSSREMARLGIPLMAAAILLLVLFSHTYWRWIGVL